MEEYCYDVIITQGDLQINTIPIKIPTNSLVKIEKSIFKFVWSIEAREILKKKNRVGGLKLSKFKLYYKAAVCKIMWYCHKDRHIDQWNKIKFQKQTHTYLQTIDFWKVTKYMKWGVSLFNKWLWEHLDIHRQKNKARTLPHTIYQKKLKMDKRPKYELKI